MMPIYYNLSQSLSMLSLSIFNLTKNGKDRNLIKRLNGRICSCILISSLCFQGNPYTGSL